MTTSVTALLLHGFGGSGASWAGVGAAAGGRYRLLTPDLRGHGTAATRRPVDLDGVLADLEPVLRDAAARGPVVIGGYSLGGRVALQLAARAPDAVAGLLLVSTTAGLEDDAARAARRTADAALAGRLRTEGLAAFAEHWGALDLWVGDPPHVRVAQRDELLAGDPAGLAAAVEGLSPGRLTPLWTALPAIDARTRVLAGGRDARYLSLADRLTATLPRAMRTVVPGAGHGLLREAPATVAAALDALARDARDGPALQAD